MTESQSAHMDRHVRNTERSRAFRGPQMAFALLDGAMRHYRKVKRGANYSPIYDTIMEHVRGMQ